MKNQKAPEVLANSLTDEKRAKLRRKLWWMSRLIHVLIAICAFFDKLKASYARVKASAKDALLRLFQVPGVLYVIMTAMAIRNAVRPSVILQKVQDRGQEIFQLLIVRRCGQIVMALPVRETPKQWTPYTTVPYPEWPGHRSESITEIAQDLPIPEKEPALKPSGKTVLLSSKDVAETLKKLVEEDKPKKSAPKKKATKPVVRKKKGK